MTVEHEPWARPDHPAPVISFAVGEPIGPYRILARLGDGGAGEVFRARDPRLGRDVAVKVLRDRFASDLGRARFQREAKAIAKLSHPHVLTIYDVGDHRGLPYLVTELLVGETLRARLARGPVPLDLALTWGRQIASGLAAAHARGVIHRDLKPANLFVVAGGGLKILDFGLARTATGADDERLSAPGEVLGTAGYLAPEQARGEEVSGASDLFSLGAVLFELVTGVRAFPGGSAVEQLDAVLSLQPPAPSSLRPELPAALDRLIARCLAKAPAERFESARDLGFALELVGGVAAPAGRGRRRLAWLVGALGLAGLLAAGAWMTTRPARREVAATLPVRSYPLTYGGRERHPSMSADGDFLAFTSDRDGRSRIWIQHLPSGSEAARTEGPDRAPRFSSQRNEILFTRDVGGTSALYRVGLVGEPIAVCADASDGDWSPDGEQVAFIRARQVAGGQVEPVVMLARVDGSGERELYRLSGRAVRGRGVEQRVRWSPDDRYIAVSGYLPLPGMSQQILLIPVHGGPPKVLEPPSPFGLVSAVAWESPDSIVYSQALSVSGNSAGSAARLVRQRTSDGAITTLDWLPESSFVVDLWPGRGVVYDVRSARTNLRSIGRADGAVRVLSQGTSTDRQPRLSPDGKRLVFTSNRGGDLDIWVLDLTSGESHRLMQRAGEDWDPAFTADGRSLLWSSNQSGNFEIWSASVVSGTAQAPRQVTRDGIDAENPTATADGAWIVYSSNAPGREGIWRIRPDGSEPRRLVPAGILPEVSPDGRHVLYVVNRGPRQAEIRVAQVEDGAPVPFAIEVEIRAAGQAVLGRARWLPDGKAIAFVGQDEAGRPGVFVQDFAPGRDTAASRRPLAGFDPERSTESFAVDASTVILAESDRRSDVMAAVGLPP